MKNVKFGFGLIEIIIVLAILGIILAFAYPAFQNRNSQIADTAPESAVTADVVTSEPAAADTAPESAVTADVVTSEPADSPVEESVDSK